MKKLMIAAAVAALCGAAQAAYKDGVYAGTGTGNAGPIDVKVTVEGGVVKGVEVVKQGETPMLFEAAKKKVVKYVVKNNKTEGVKLVSGATNSSKGLVTAVNDALAKAK